MNKSDHRELLVDGTVDCSVIGSSSCSKGPMNHHCTDQHSVNVIAQPRSWSANVTKNAGFRFEDDEDDDDEADAEFEYIPLWRADGATGQKDNTVIDSSIAVNPKLNLRAVVTNEVSSSAESNSGIPSEDDIRTVCNVGNKDNLYGTRPVSIPSMPVEDVSSLAAICSQISSSPIESRLGRFSDASPPSTKRGDMHRRKRVRSGAKVASAGIHTAGDVAQSSSGHSKDDGCFTEVPSSQFNASPGKSTRNSSVNNSVANSSPVVRCPPPIPPRHNINAALPAVLQIASEFHGSDGVVLSEIIEDKSDGLVRASIGNPVARGLVKPQLPAEIRSVSRSNSAEDNIYEEVPFSKIYEDLSDLHRSNGMVSDYSGSGDCGVTMRVRSATDPTTAASAYANRKSLVEEVMYEVERVQRQHDQVLKELNLDMEAMIMPPSHSSSSTYSDNDTSSVTENCGHHHNGGCDAVLTPPTSRKQSTASVGLPSSTALADIPRVYPHVRSLSLSACSQRDLPSLPSRTSSPLSFLKRDTLKLNQGAVTSTPVAKRKWIKLPSLSGSKEKAVATECSYSKVKDSTDEPVYMLYDDSHRQDGYSKGEYNCGKFHFNSYSEDGIYEDIEQNLIGSASARFGSRNSSLRRSDGGAEDSEEFESFEERSDAESEKSASGVSLASIKNKLRSVTRRMSKIKEDAKAKETYVDKRQLSMFTWRKEYDFDRSKDASLKIKPPESREVEEFGTFRLQLQPPSLPPIPSGLSPEQVKRRYIISALVHSENTYVATLKRLIQDYKKPLEESHPPILNKVKIDTLFFRVPEIQQCHAMFRIALSDCIKRWDKEEKIGEVFVASFSKSMVLDIYSGFINNFSAAMELAKQESQRKSAFSDFLKVKQITSHDRLSFFGLMVKPVQRFPQFILLLQDLLKHTPHGHHDRMNLQMALTQLETLAEMLNERKRESEQHHAVKELMRQVSAKFSSVRSISDGSHYLLRQDNVQQLKFDQDGHITKTKERRLHLLNDLLVCVSVSPSSTDSLSSTQRLSLKWAVPVVDVEIQEESSPTLNRLITSASRGKTITGKMDKAAGGDAGNFQVIYQEMADLMHDFEVMSRLTALIETLKKSYPGLTSDLTQRHSQAILRAVQERDEEMKWMDNCCLQLLVPLKPKTAKELLTFQTSGPAVTKEWISELRLAQLALDTNNSPAWDIPEQERRPSTKMPLFVKSLPVYSAAYPTEVKSACSYVCSAKPPSSKLHNYLWVCSSDGVNSHITILNLSHVVAKVVVSFDLTEVRISTMESVPGSATYCRDAKFRGWTIWMGTDSRRILLFSGSDPEKHESVGFVSVSASVLQIRHYADQVFAALANGKVMIFHRTADGSWDLKDSTVVNLSAEPVTSLLPYNNCMYCACGRKVWVLDGVSGEIVKSFVVQHEQMGNVYLLAQSGIGLWINLRNTATICLYHMETFRHLQDINVASNINRILAEKDQTMSPRNIFVTSLLACRGLLWVGTNVGVVLTIPLPRLEGVPIISGRASLSYHMLAGPVTTLVTLNTVQPQISINPAPQSKSSNKTHSAESQNRLTKQLSLCNPVANKVVLPLRPQMSSPSLLPSGSHKLDLHHRSSSPFSKKLGSKTSSISSSSTSSSSPSCSEGAVSSTQGNEGDYDVYGLYGDLLNVRQYIDDVGHDMLYEPLRRSEPDLLPNTISTLDRRLRMKVGRPKSLDLTNLCTGPSDLTYLSTSSDGGSSSSSSSVSASCMSIAGEPGSQVNPTHGNLPAPTATPQPSMQQSPRSAGANAELPRTVITIMGGRGYTNIRQARSNTRDRSAVTMHTNEAYIVLWELKL